ncbi:C45 family peptidase [bacterium]|jgi:hypothetical protein|nr:C45 family peptidase [bacterium]
MPRQFAWTVIVLAIFSSSEKCWAESRVVYESGNIQAAVLEGSWRQIGSDAARLSRLDQKQLLPLVIKRNFDRLVNENVPDQGNMRARPGIFLTKLIAKIPAEDMEIFKGVSESLNISADEIARAYLIPEMNNYIAIALKTKSQAAIMGLFNCTSFSTQASDVRILARNMDFPGTGILDKSLALYLLVPEQGHKILTVSPRGIPVPGISGMNDQGLSLVLHTAYSKSIDMEGASAPVLSINREILQKAASIDEAVAIYKKYRYRSGWLVHVADSKSSAVIELSGKGVTVFQRETGLTALTNSYQSERERADELRFSPGAELHNRDRLARLYELAPGVKQISDAMGVLSDSYSPYSRSQVDFSNSAIRAVDQVSSMIFVPNKAELWVADGLTPSSLGTFYRFSIDQMLKAERPLPIENSAQPVPASHRYGLANAEINQNSNGKAGYTQLLEAGKLARDCSFDLMIGSQAMSRKENETAAKALASAATCQVLSPHHQAIALYLKGLNLIILKAPLKDSGEYLSAALQLEVALPKTLGIDADSSLIKGIQEDLASINAGKEPSGLRFRDYGLDFKVGDKVLGW